MNSTIVNENIIHSIQCLQNNFTSSLDSNITLVSLAIILMNRRIYYTKTKNV